MKIAIYSPSKCIVKFAIPFVTSALIAVAPHAPAFADAKFDDGGGKAISKKSCSELLRGLDKDRQIEAQVRQVEIVEDKRIIKVTRKEINRYAKNANQIEARLVIEDDPKKRRSMQKDLRIENRYLRRSKAINNQMVGDLADHEAQLKQVKQRIKDTRAALKKNKC